MSDEREPRAEHPVWLAIKAAQRACPHCRRQRQRTHLGLWCPRCQGGDTNRPASWVDKLPIIDN